MRAIWKGFGPIFLSALSLFISALLIHILSFYTLPTYSPFAAKGAGKNILLFMGVLQTLSFMAIRSRIEWQRFFNEFCFWIFNAQRWRTFFYFFIRFAIFHTLLLGIYASTGHAALQKASVAPPQRLLLHLALIFIAPIVLAWGEELIFRGLLFNFLKKYCSLATSIFSASLIFALSHDAQHPLSLLTTRWQLGLGLFLLGAFLSLIAEWKQTLAASAGVHAGLVYVKVLLRKFPIITIPASSPYLFPIDLRESLIVHALLLCGSVFVYRTRIKR